MVNLFIFLMIFVIFMLVEFYGYFEDLFVWGLMWVLGWDIL